MTVHPADLLAALLLCVPTPRNRFTISRGPRSSEVRS